MPPGDCGCHLLKRSGSVLASCSYSSLLFPKKRKAKRKIPKACYFTYYPTPENKRQEEKSQTTFGVASVWPRCHSLTRLSSPQSLGGSTATNVPATVRCFLFKTGSAVLRVRFRQLPRQHSSRFSEVFRHARAAEIERP